MFDIKWTRASYLLFFVALAPCATGPAAACGAEDAVRMLPDDHYFSPAGSEGETFCFRIDLDFAGALIVSVAAPGTAEPKLRVAEHQGAAAALAVGGRGASRLILWAGEPGAYVFEVAAEDARAALGEHIVSSVFVADAVELGDAGPRTKDGDEAEIDPILATTPQTGGSASGLQISVLLFFDAGRQ
jgi:hypothetical protein